jgi:hypothetical protein
MPNSSDRKINRLRTPFEEAGETGIIHGYFVKIVDVVYSEVLAKCLAIHVEKAVLRDSQFIFYRKLGFSS